MLINEYVLTHRCIFGDKSQKYSLLSKLKQRQTNGKIDLSVCNFLPLDRSLKKGGPLQKEGNKLPYENLDGLTAAIHNPITGDSAEPMAAFMLHGYVSLTGSDREISLHFERHWSFAFFL